MSGKVPKLLLSLAARVLIPVPKSIVSESNTDKHFFFVDFFSFDFKIKLIVNVVVGREVFEFLRQCYFAPHNATNTGFR